MVFGLYLNKISFRQYIVSLSASGHWLEGVIPGAVAAILQSCASLMTGLICWGYQNKEENNQLSVDVVEFLK